MPLVESPLTASDRHMNSFPFVRKPKAQPRTEATTGMASLGAEKGIRIIDESSRDIGPNE
jgi:hypothetical protein